MPLPCLRVALSTATHICLAVRCEALSLMLRLAGSPDVLVHLLRVHLREGGV